MKRPIMPFDQEITDHEGIPVKPGAHGRESEVDFPEEWGHQPGKVYSCGPDVKSDAKPDSVLAQALRAVSSDETPEEPSGGWEAP